MNTTIRRSRFRGSTSITAGTKTPAIDLRGMAGGVFKIPAGWGGGATVSFELAGDPLEDGDFAPLHDSTDTVVSQAVTAGRWYAFPDAVLKAGAVKIVAASSTTAVILYHLRA